jgi:hypothetical protein
MVELKKEYTIFWTMTIVRHEAIIAHCLFHERIERSYGQEDITFDTKEEAEEYIKDTINNYKPNQKLKSDEVTIEKDINNNNIITKLFIASEGDFIRHHRKTLRRKKSPYFTIYVHYAIVESMYGYGDNEEQWKNDYYTDEFRYPIYA